MCFLASCVLAACSGDSNNSDAGADQSDPPAADTPGAANGENPHQPDGFGVSASSPVPGAQQQALVRDVAIDFTDPPMTETLEADSVYLSEDGRRVPAQLEHSPGSTRVTLTPENPLTPETRYSVHVTEAVMSADGATFTGTTWEFTTAANVGATSQEVLDSCMSDLDIEMLAQVNNARASARSCGTEEAPAVAPLSWNCTIQAAAQAHSDDMAQLNFFNHTGSDGTSAGHRLTEAGYQWSTWGENIAAGQTSVEQVVRELLDSPGHCRNIMNGSFTEIGTALAENSEADYRLYWTQNFAAPR